MRKCSPEGRDCIEKKSTSTFNCSVACEGIYADVQWVENVVEAMGEEPVEDEVEKKLSGKYVDEMTRLVYKNLKKEIEMIKGGKKGDELGQKFKKLMSEYKQFKNNQVQHFRFDSAATSFGKYKPMKIKFKTNEISGVDFAEILISDDTLILVGIKKLHRGNPGNGRANIWHLRSNAQ